MNNPFGLPDEVMTAIITAVANQQKASEKQTRNNFLSPENPFKFDTVKMAKKSASMVKQLYDAYVEAGFTEEQAFDLVKGILTAKKN